MQSATEICLGCEVYVLSEAFSNSIFQFYVRKDLKDEELSVVLVNVRLVKCPTSVEERPTATSLTFSVGLQGSN